MEEKLFSLSNDLNDFDSVNDDRHIDGSRSVDCKKVLHDFTETKTLLIS